MDGIAGETPGLDCKTPENVAIKSVASLGNGVTVAFRVLGQAVDILRVVFQGPLI
jgi:hypothetical protein